MQTGQTSELEFHRETIMSNDSSPLHLIREKEIEISGRILAAKRQADEIVAAARREAVAIVAEAKGDASHIAQEHDLAARLEVEKQAEQLRAEAAAEIARIEETAASRSREAVDHVLRAVLGIWGPFGRGR